MTPCAHTVHTARFTFVCTRPKHDRHPDEHYMVREGRAG